MTWPVVAEARWAAVAREAEEWRKERWEEGGREGRRRRGGKEEGEVGGGGEWKERDDRGRELRI